MESQEFVLVFLGKNGTKNPGIYGTSTAGENFLTSFGKKGTLEILGKIGRGSSK